jgi:hypothetical protein
MKGTYYSASLEKVAKVREIRGPRRWLGAGRMFSTTERFPLLDDHLLAMDALAHARAITQ